MDTEKLKSLFQFKDSSKLNGNSEINNFLIFDNLNAHEAAIIERHLYRRLYKAGERIVKEGDAAVVLYFLSSGSAKVVKSAGNKQIELAALKPGAFFGEISLIEEQQRSATVIAVESSEVLCLFQPDFTSILKKHPSIFTKFLEKFTPILLNRINNMNKEIQKLRNNEEDHTA
ncbi:MAG: cyclic nucleotide-binding domain-containing protein [bacterium]|nr:cyclic nucleotide-binding domain-containing protein [bacterium]